MGSAAHLEAFLIKQGMLFLHVSNVLSVRLQSHALYAKAWYHYSAQTKPTSGHERYGNQQIKLLWYLGKEWS